MRKIIFTFITFLTLSFVGYAQNNINYNKTYAAGGRLLMCVDSNAKNVYYRDALPNQPNTFFSYLPGVDNISLQIYFRKEEKISNYRYTILTDDKPIVVNKSIETSKLKEVVRPDINNKDEVLNFTSLGIFAVKGHTLTILIYSIENPLNIQKSIFYGKTFRKAYISAFIKHYYTKEKGFQHKWIIAPKESMNLALGEDDLSLTLVKNKTNIDYMYYTSIKEKKTNKTVYESSAWDFSILTEDGRGYLASMKIDKNVFKKSGDYEIIIQPLMNWKHCWKCGISTNEIENYRRKYTLSVTIEDESYTKKEAFTYAFIITLSIGLVFLVVLFFIKKENKKKLVLREKQENIIKLQLNSIRSQLNPHFLFNALSGIQNLINKNEIESANKYLTRFARLTRMILENKELVSLSEEKKLLEDYLQMEKLRFGFKFNIFHSEGLELGNIEIPSMLLQPFVENAVKHAIALKASEGQIIITFTEHGKDLVLTIKDNGNGFDINTKSTGLGLQLSENRIALLNSTYKENHFILAIQSDNKGTIISITLKGWL